MNEHVDLCLWKSVFFTFYSWKETGMVLTLDACLPGSEEGMRAVEEDQEDARGMMTHQHNSKETSGSETKRKLDQHQHASTSTSASSSASSAKRAKSNRSSGCSTSRKKSSKAVSILDWCQKPSGKWSLLSCTCSLDDHRQSCWIPPATSAMYTTSAMYIYPVRQFLYSTNLKFFLILYVNFRVTLIVFVLCKICFRLGMLC
jgi:hypothetical protein